MSGVEAKKNTNFQRKKDHRRQNNRLFQEKFQPSSTKTTDGEIWKVTRKNFIWNPNENKLLLFKHFLYLSQLFFLQNFLLHILWPLSQFSSFSTDFLSWFTVSKLSYLLFWLEKDKQNARCCNNLLYAGITRIILQTRNI